MTTGRELLMLLHISNKAVMRVGFALRLSEDANAPSLVQYEALMINTLSFTHTVSSCL